MASANPDSALLSMGGSWRRAVCRAVRHKQRYIFVVEKTKLIGGRSTGTDCTSNSTSPMKKLVPATSEQQQHTELHRQHGGE